VKKFLVLIVFATSALAGAAGGFAAKQALALNVGKDDADERPEDESHDGRRGAAQPVYVKFSRQLVAPLVKEGFPEALVILDVQIETAPGADEAAYALEPKLRDAFLSALMARGARGALAAVAENPDELRKLKAEMLAAARTILGDDAVSVLVTDIAVQPLR
jgi:hypothetical protein